MQIDRSVLISIREAYPLTKTELAERVGVSRNAVRDIESGKTFAPRPGTVRKIAEALSVDVSELWLRGDGEMGDGGKGSGRKSKRAADEHLMGRLRKAGKSDAPPPSVAANARKAFKARKAS
jgi:transcriptional regulator with XRE-family HTH domain